MSKLSKSVLTLVASGASALAIAAAFVDEKEGLSLTAYLDAVNVWTICRGHTAGVRPGQTATPAQCEAFFRSDMGLFIAGVYRVIDGEDAPAPVVAAATSLCFNVGLGTCRPVLVRIRDGRFAEACNVIPLYIRAQGRDCRIAANNCRGIPTRRAEEAELCRLGL